MVANARKCINDFSAPSSANIKTGPETNVEDSHFELKPGLINMVQHSPFYGKDSEDVNAYLQHFLEICSAFTIHEVNHDVVRLCLFPLPLLGKAKQWFYANREVASTWETCSPMHFSPKQWFYANREVASTWEKCSPMHFSPSFFRWVKPMPFGIRSPAFNSSQMRPSSRHENAYRIISLCAHAIGWKSGSSSKATILG
jgi:hypothetical protein